MTTGHHQPPAVTAEQLTCALLEVAATLRWPGGSLLLDLDVEVLREQLSPRLLTALSVAVTAVPAPAAAGSPGAAPWPPLTDLHARQEPSC